MAKLNGVFKFEGTFDGVTTVNSRAYGHHIRRARKTFTIGKEMKRSSEALKQAVRYAKAFKGAIAPYRLDFRDGSLWRRIVPLFKKAIQKNDKADFSLLAKLELNELHPLGRVLAARATLTQREDTLNVRVTSRHMQNPIGRQADGYLQTVIVLFADDDLKFEAFSESVNISFQAVPGEQEMNCPIPKSATMAMVVVKCNFSFNGKALDMQMGMGMAVIEVMAVVKVMEPFAVVTDGIKMC